MAAFSRGYRTYGSITSTLISSLRIAQPRLPIQCLYASTTFRSFSQSSAHPLSIKEEVRHKLQALKEQTQTQRQDTNQRDASALPSRSSAGVTAVSRRLPVRKWVPEYALDAQDASFMGKSPTEAISQTNELNKLYSNLLERNGPATLYKSERNPALTSATVIFSSFALMFMGSISYLYFADGGLGELTAAGFVTWKYYVMASIMLGIPLAFTCLQYLALVKRVRSITLIPNQASAKGTISTFTARIEGRGVVPFTRKTVEVPLDSIRVATPFLYTDIRSGATIVPLTGLPLWQKPIAGFGNWARRICAEELNVLPLPKKPWVCLWTDKRDKGRLLAWKVDVRGSAMKGAEGFDFFVKSDNTS